MNRTTAVQLLEEWVPSPGLRRHCYCVEAVMRSAAVRYGSASDDPEKWGLAGLLHDADWEKWPDEHPNRIVQHLRDLGEADVADAVAAHSLRWGRPHTTAMSKALVASDELAGLVVACVLLRPDGILTLDVPGVLKKFRTAKFAAGVDRNEVTEGVRILGVSLEDHTAFVLDALRAKADDLGLGPK
ncbi:MAG TPA: HD domain-containing protein [Fimbriiglobus sp.]|jgi:predicted hydrolase (HD superfamily)